MGSRAAAQERQRRWATALLFLPALIQAFPIFYLACISFKVGGEVIQYPPELLPNSLNLINYREALEAAPLARFLLNSLLVATGTASFLARAA